MPGDGGAEQAVPLSSIYSRAAPGRLFQGEIVEDLIEWIPAYSQAAPPEVEGTRRMVHRLAVVMTQDCDLAQDWQKRSSRLLEETALVNVLLCPAKLAESERQGAALRSTDLWGQVQNNKVERYQYLAEVPALEDFGETGHGPLLIDFKAQFMIRTVEVYRQLCTPSGPKRRFRLNVPWREHLLSRFSYFQGRIGLERDHHIPASRRGTAPA